MGINDGSALGDIVGIRVGEKVGKLVVGRLVVGDAVGVEGI